MLFKESYGSRLSRHTDTTNKLEDHASFKSKSDRDTTHMRNYASGSSDLNKRLIKGGELSSGQQATHDTIKKSVKPFNETHTLYAGVGTDFGKLAMKSTDHVLHSSAHLSTTHRFDVAQKFAKGDGDSVNMIRITARPHHKGVYIANSVGVPTEHETILPAGTKLQYLGTTHHNWNRKHDFEEGDGYGGKVLHKIHHFEIHSQE